MKGMKILLFNFLLGLSIIASANPLKIVRMLMSPNEVRIDKIFLNDKPNRLLMNVSRSIPF